MVTTEMETGRPCKSSEEGFFFSLVNWIATENEESQEPCSSQVTWDEHTAIVQTAS